MSERHLEGSMTILDHLMKRKYPFLVKMHVNIVDVRDVAKAHVKALTMGPDGGRYIVLAAASSRTEVGQDCVDEISDILAIGVSSTTFVCLGSEKHWNDV